MTSVVSTRARLHAVGRRHPLVLVSIGVLCYALGPVMVGAGEASGPVMSFWRLWFGVGVMGLAAVVGARASGRRPTLRAWRWAAYAGLAFGAHQLLFFSAIRATSVVDVSLMNVLAPVVIGIAAIPLFGERPGLRFRSWTVVAMVGAAIVVAGAAGGPDGAPLGMTLALANVVFFAVFFLLSKLGRDHLDVLPFLFGTMLVAAVAVTAWCLATGDAVTAASRTDLWLAFAIAAGPGALGHVAMTWPLRWVAANVPPVMRLVQPAISGLLAWVLLAEPITGYHLGGGALTLAGVAGALLAPGRSARGVGAPPGDDARGSPAG